MTVCVLRLVEDLAADLDAARISWCHWKSNCNLHLAFVGDNDLDLLVAAGDRQVFEARLRALGFRQFSSHTESWTAGIFNFHGLDVDSGVIVHVHAHYALNVGIDLLKNYHLPVEAMYLADTRRCGPLPVPDPAREYVVFVARMALKRRLLGVFLGGPRRWLTFIAGRGPQGLAGSDARELAWLMEQADDEARARAKAMLLPQVTDAVWKRCEESLRSDASRRERLAAGGALAACLGGYAIRPPLPAALTLVGRRLAMAARNRLGRRVGGKRARGGGIIVAVVGGDGAGKTTNLKAIRKWLGGDFAVVNLHYGKPPAGPARRLWAACLRIARPVLGIDHERYPALAQAIGYHLLARDRLRALQWAARARDQGAIVLCDRYPVPGIAMMDAPQIATRFGTGGILGALARGEERAYASSPAADVRIVLRLPPEVAALRKPEDGEAYVLARNGELWSREWSPVTDLVIAADGDLLAIQATIRERIWDTIGARQRVVEILGPPGAGKTTLLDGLKPRRPGLRSRLAIRRHRCFAAGRLARKWPQLVTRMAQGFPPRIAWTMFVIETQADLLAARDRIDTLKYGSFLLDEGPLAGLVWVVNECRGTGREACARDWLRSTALRLVGAMDAVCIIDAPAEVLNARINERARDHRVKGRDPAVFAAFVENVRENIAAIRGAIGDHTVVAELDSARTGPEEAVVRLALLLEIVTRP